MQHPLRKILLDHDGKHAYSITSSYRNELLPLIVPLLARDKYYADASKQVHRVRK